MSVLRLPLAALVTALILLPTAAAAQLRVSVVDWVQGRPEIPHPALNGQPTMLQAIAEAGNCAGTYRYRWDINGDADFDDANEGFRNAASAPYAGYFAPLGLDVTLPAAQGDRLFYPKVEVECGAERATATMPIKVTVERLCPGYPANENCAAGQSIGLTRMVHANRSVDRALWYMFQRFSHRADDGQGHAVHVCTYPGAPAMYGHGHALNAFLRRSHGHGPGRDTDVYYRHVTQCGVHALLTTYSMRAGLHFDDTNAAGIDGQAITYANGVLGGQPYFSSYASTAWVEPMANFGNPDYVAPAGPANIFGRTLRSIGQDLADGLVQCMGADGGWYYSCQNGGGSTNDASTDGWAPESLRLLQRKFGTETYGWARDRQRAWLGANCANGSCVYHNGGFKLSGNALVGYGWTENQTYNPNNAAVRAHVTAIQNFTPGAHYWGLYYLYASTKGLRSFVPEITYLPNGRDWSAQYNLNLIPLQAADGSWNWVGSWDWGGSVDLNTRTAMTTQIIQTWLETQAWARATPAASGPGIDITFDHSWSHVLDPAVTITRYRWNVIDLAGEDLNGNGRVEGAEIVWDYTTADRNAPFVFQYSDDLDWGQVITRNVLLEVTDSQGRTVIDDANVQIELSLRNHLPVIVAHPDGGDAVYSGYLGTPIVLDGRTTYDVDTDHPVFPGDANRPVGLPDRITTIHFDLNLDGDFTDPGEDGTNGPVTFIPRAGMALGDRIAVPIRACDDGQWNGECYDGRTRPDCSECAFGAASVTVVQNVDPPLIAPGGPYAGQPDEAIPLDLSGTRDPEGVLGLTYRYDLIRGEGTLRPTPGYPGGAGDWGPRPIYTPNPDGARIDLIRATVTDYGGMASQRDIQVAVANVPPIIDAWQVGYTGRTPLVLGGVRIENLGNGRYRASIDAIPDSRWDARLEYQAHDPHGEPITADADIDGDGAREGAVAGNQGIIGVAIVDAGELHSATLFVSDGDDTVNQTRELRAPPVDPTLRYFFDIGGDGRYEVAGGGLSYVEFQVPPGTAQIRVTGDVRGVGGAPAPFDQVAPLGNRPPAFEVARIVGQDDFAVVITASAVDPDADRLTYTINWGDGSPPTVSQGGMAEHEYPDGVYRAYDITVTVDDGRGGTAQRRLAIDFPEPPDNRPPVFEFARVLDKDGFVVVVAASAVDPDGDELTYTFDWDDASPDTQNRGGVAEHTFPAGVFRGYAITITADDGRGGRAQRVVPVTFDAPPANRAPLFDSLDEIGRDGFEVVLAAGAIDPDGDALTYTFQWADGTPDTRNAGGIATHTFPAGQFRAYTVTVIATDGRGGEARDTLEVSFARPADNRAPVIDQFVQIGRNGFEVIVSASAVDPDGDGLTYTFNWGDGTPPSANAGGVAPHTYPANQFRGYDAEVVVTDGRGGEARRALRIAFAAPAANEAPVFARLDEISRDGFRVAIAASAVDPNGDALSYSFNWGDGSPAAATPGGVLVHDFPANQFRRYTVTVTVTDGRGGQAQRTIEINFPAPAQNRAPAIDFAREIGRTGFEVVLSASATDPDGDPLTYTFAWGDGGAPMQNAGGVGVHLYPAGQFRAYTVTITVTDGRGGNAQTELQVAFAAPAQNRAPTIEVAREMGRDGFEVIVSATAIDPDGDALTYTFIWGDGAPQTRNGGGLAAHTYPAGQFRAYTIDVLIDDGRGGQDTATIEINFPPPAQNRAPAVDALAEIGRDGFEVVLSATATDPDGDRITYTFNWGDGSPATVSAGGLAVHEFPRNRFERYTVTVTATDGRGGSAQRTIELNFPAPAQNRPPVIEVARVLGVDGFDAILTATAADEDGDTLRYTFAWGDGSPNLSNAGGVAAHAFPANVFRAYTVTITVDDGRGGSASTEVEVDFPPPAQNVAPFFEVARVLSRDGFAVVFTATAVDPNGDAITYTFNWGDGSPPTQNRAGLAEHAWPVGEYRTYTVTITADDGRGGTVETTVDVEFTAPDQNRAPVIEVARVLARDGFEVTVTASAVDPDGDLLTYTFDWSDGSAPTVNQAGLAAHAYPAGEYRPYTVTITARDGRGGSVSAEVEIEFIAPDQNRAPAFELVRELGRDGFAITLAASAVDPDGDGLTYTFDWNDGTPPTANAGGIAAHAYPAGEYRTYTVTVTVTDGRGGEASHDLEISFRAPDQNRPPVIEELRLVRQEAFEVLAVVGAVDPDGDALTYTFDWADGSAPTANRSGLAAHRFPAEVYQRYTVTVTADDGRGGRVSAEASITFVAPAENRPPVIRDITLVVGPRGAAELIVDAVDPEGGPLTWFVTWGDAGNDLVRLAGGRGPHTYAYPVDAAPYLGRVIVQDDAGLETEGEFTAEIIDAPTVIREVTQREIRLGTWFFDILADDPDSPGALLYGYDFQADGTDEIAGAENSEGVWIYDPPGQYRVRVSVTDPWSGATVQAEITVGLDGDDPLNLPPRIEEIFVEIGPGGQTTVAVDAIDPEGGPLTAHILWGDTAEGIEPEWQPMPNMTARHGYAYDPDGVPYTGTVRITDTLGRAIEAPFDAPIPDLPTRMTEVSVSDAGQGQITVRAAARDPDTAALTYAFDFDGDGTLDTARLAEGIASYTYLAPGEYTLRIEVTDTWSGVATFFDHAIELDEWVVRPPLPDGQVQGLEGQCLVFQITAEGLSNRVDDAVCTRAENPDEANWTWTFGDGEFALGSEVGHRYTDEGVYRAKVDGGPPPIAAKITVSIANQPPIFVTEPPELATAGDSYHYAVEISDLGATDEIELELTEAPDGMTLERVEDREFKITWTVPADLSGEVVVELRATDGHREGGIWIPDGGRATQRYIIRISGDIDPVFEPDGGIPGNGEADGGVDLDNFSGTSGCACDTSDGSPAGALIALLGLIGLGATRRRRHR